LLKGRQAVQLAFRAFFAVFRAAGFLLAPERFAEPERRAGASSRSCPRSAAMLFFSNVSRFDGPFLCLKKSPGVTQRSRGI
jgi:hypothetical protein